MFYGMSENMDYFSEKVSLFIALGPVTEIAHSTVPGIHMLGWFYNSIANYLSEHGIYHFGGAASETESNILKNLCADWEELCLFVDSLIYNADPDADNPERLDVLEALENNAKPVKSILHYAQNMIQDRF